MIEALTRKRRRFVESGKFVVERPKNLILEAFLGTCVGVTLYDPEAEIGGLLHLLLPEPTGADTAWRPEAYASTGIPLFLDALHKAGARDRRMIACIAGGALVGPVCERDFSLDIGGRTTEVVRTLLDRAGIKISAAETGGYFSCSLQLDLADFSSSIQPISHSPGGNNERETDVAKPDTDEINATIRRISPIPQIALKITRMINEGDYHIGELSKEIKTDQIISAKVIQMCNSSFLALRTKVDSIDRALVIVGEKTLLKLVITASVESCYHTSQQGYSLCRGGLFQHALGTAMVAEKLAAHTGRAPADLAYTAGLLHDVGKVVLDHYLAESYPFFYRRTLTDGIDLCESETSRLGITHPEAGLLLAESWSLPQNLCDAIRFHHAPEASRVDTHLTHIIYLADLLMSRFQIGYDLDCLEVVQLEKRLARLGLAPDGFPVLVDLIPPEVFNPAFT